MSKLFLTLLSIGLMTFLNAQKVGVNLAPNLSKAYLENNFGLEKSDFGIRYGISYEHDVLKRNKIEIGIFHAQLNSRIENDLVCLTSAEFKCLDKTKFNYNYLEIPLNIKTRLGTLNKNLSTYLVSGYSFNYYFRTRTKWTFTDGSEETNTSHNNAEPNLHSINIGLDFARKLSEKLVLNIAPTYALSFSNLDIYRNNIKSLRLNFKLAYSLKKE